MTSQCLDRRISSISELRVEISEWESARDKNQKGVDWQFMTATARIKFRQTLSPKIEIQHFISSNESE